MKCPKCNGGDHRVIRSDDTGTEIRRRRECLDCGGRWTTLEVPCAVVERANDIVAAFERMKEVIPGEG